MLENVFNWSAYIGEGHVEGLDLVENGDCSRFGKQGVNEQD
jgi:hypothetical protein